MPLHNEEDQAVHHLQAGELRLEEEHLQEPLHLMPIHHLSGKIKSPRVCVSICSFYLLPGTYRRLLALDEQTLWRLFTPTSTWASRAVERTFLVRLPLKFWNNSNSSSIFTQRVQMLNFQWQNKRRTLRGTYLTRFHGRDSSFPFVQQIYN